MAEKNTTNQEEVDLGQLFKLIGNGFKNMFNGIATFFKTIFHYIILTLIFLKKHALILGAAAIIGGGIGLLLSIKFDKIFESKTILDTNFGSGHQLYKQTDFLNSLIKNEDLKKISTTLKITDQEAASLNKFFVEPYDKEKNLLLDYDKFMQNTDTIYTKGYTIDMFKKRYNDPDYKLQIITVKGSDKNVFIKLNNVINDLIINDFYTKKLTLKTEELIQHKKVLTKELADIDSLRIRYKKVALLNANRKENTGTNINLLEKQMSSNDNKDIALFKQSNKILQQIKNVNNDIIKKGYIIQQITKFDIGEEPNKILDKKWLKFAIIGFILALVGIFIIWLNTFLNNYQQNKQSYE